MAGPNWFVSNAGRVEGPFKASDLATNRLLVPSSYVWHDGLDEWELVTESELAPLVADLDADSSMSSGWPDEPSGAGAPGGPPVPGNGATPAGRGSWDDIDPEAGAAPGPSPWSVAAMACGALAILFFPILLGPFGMVLAGVGFRRQEPRAALGMGIAVGGMVLGFILAFLAVSGGISDGVDAVDALRSTRP